MTTYYTIIIVLNDDARIYMVCYTMTMWSMLTISTGQLGPVRNEMWDRQYGGSSSLAIIEAVTPLKLVRRFWLIFAYGKENWNYKRDIMQYAIIKNVL